MLNFSAALYYPDTDACYPAYRQGPCKYGEMLALTDDSDILPSCISNDCRADGQISVEKSCYKLESFGPCQSTFLNTFVLSVNPKTLRVDCMPLTISFGPRFGGDVSRNQPKFNAETMKFCAKGTKRAIQNLCQVDSN